VIKNRTNNGLPDHFIVFNLLLAWICFHRVLD